MPLQIRRGTQAERDGLVADNIALAVGEPLWTTDEGNLYVGDGVTPGGILVNTAVETDLSAYVGNIGGIEKDPIGDPGITSPFITLDGSTVTIDLDRQISTSITPKDNGIFSLGEDDFRFRQLFVSDFGIEIGEATITSSGTFVQLPEGSTVGGVEIGTGGGVVEGESYKINIVGDDDSTIVDSELSIVTASGGFFGDLTGSIIGDDDTILVDATNLKLQTQNLEMSDNQIISNNGFVSIGTDTDPQTLNIYSGNNSAFIDGYGITDDSGESPWVSLYISRGTVDLPETVESGDILSGILIFGHDGDDYSRSVTIAGRVDNNGTVTSNSVPGEFLVIVRSSINAGDSEFLSFNSKGTLSAPVVKPGVFADAAARDLYIDSPTPGMMIYLEDDGSQSGSPKVPKFQGYLGEPVNAWVNFN